MREIDVLRMENAELKHKARYLYDYNSMEYAKKVLMASKVEGFEYKDAHFEAVADEKNIEKQIESLKSRGYNIVIVMAEIDRFDYMKEINK